MWSAKLFIIYLNQLQKMERETIMLNSVNNQFSLKKRKIRYLKVEHSFNPGRNNKVTWSSVGGRMYDVSSRGLSGLLNHKLVHRHYDWSKIRFILFFNLNNEYIIQTFINIIIVFVVSIVGRFETNFQWVILQINTFCTMHSKFDFTRISTYALLLMLKVKRMLLLK